MASLKSRVHESLDNALDNGYEDILTNRSEEIALELGMYDADLEDEDADDLVPHIKSWQESKRGAR